jgi:hypothetical protein
VLGSDKIATLDEAGLLKLLHRTFQYTSVRELKSIPSAVIRRLPKIPEGYLLKLSTKPDLLNVVLLAVLFGLLNSPVSSQEMPLHVRQQTWEMYPQLFISAVSGLCSSFAEHQKVIAASEELGFLYLNIDFRCVYVREWRATHNTRFFIHLGRLANQRAAEMRPR